jgi:dipeptidyl aminopeptidase/acylaminoacyl peptidase
MSKRVRPYGSWGSAIDAGEVASAAKRLSQPRLDCGAVYWLEGRPADGGRQAVVRYDAGQLGDVTPPDVNVRTLVHEYGGGDYQVGRGRMFFVSFADQRIYVSQGGRLAPLSTAAGSRYADFAITPDDRWLLAVEERERAGREAENRLVGFPLPAQGVPNQPAEPVVIAAGHDFYAAPCVAPAGDRIAFVAWDHPNMPWDATRLYVQAWGAGGSAGESRCVAGEGEGEAIQQPAFSPAGVITCVSDRSGWWNLQQLRGGEWRSLCPRSAEFGGPPWVFAGSSYAFVDEGQILCAYGVGGRQSLATLDVESGCLEDWALPFTGFGGLRVGDGRACFIGSAPDRPASVVVLDVSERRHQEVAVGSSLELGVEVLSQPEKIEFTSADGRSAFAWLHVPTNPAFAAPPGERPPLLVKSHGGPTASASPALDLRIQYWVSRGIAVVDVDYGGSTGYGRAYRKLLDGEWGIVDVEDCVHAALHLGEVGRVDPGRLAISGGSAGGYTTLCALTFHDVFHAGASHYGIGDLEALVRDTHKFESRYTDKLVGPYPEMKARYVERSPIHFPDRLSCPVIFFQGLDDKIVPPNQAEAMVDALAKRALPHAYVPFEGEQHGFRRAENIRTALEGELYFYSHIFGFEVDVRPQGVEIVG